MMASPFQRLNSLMVEDLPVIVPPVSFFTHAGNPAERAMPARQMMTRETKSSCHAFAILWRRTLPLTNGGMGCQMPPGQ